MDSRLSEINSFQFFSRVVLKKSNKYTNSLHPVTYKESMEHVAAIMFKGATPSYVTTAKNTQIFEKTSSQTLLNRIYIVILHFKTKKNLSDLKLLISYIFFSCTEVQEMKNILQHDNTHPTGSPAPPCIKQTPIYYDVCS